MRSLVNTLVIPTSGGQTIMTEALKLQIVQTMKNAIEPPKTYTNTFEEPPKPAIKKTTQYMTPLPSADNVKKVTFI